MRDHSCPIVTMVITPGEELDTNAVKPRVSKKNADGTYEVQLDPVSYAFMISSTGKDYVPVGLAVEQLNEFLDQQEAKKGGSSE